MNDLITTATAILKENRLNDKRFIFNITDVLAVVKKHGMSDDQIKRFKGELRPRAGKISWAEVNTAIETGGHVSKGGVNELKPSFIHDVLIDLKK